MFTLVGTPLSSSRESSRPLPGSPGWSRRPGLHDLASGGHPRGLTGPQPLGRDIMDHHQLMAGIHMSRFEAMRAEYMARVHHAKKPDPVF